MFKKNALVKYGDTVKIHCTVKLEDGKVLDTTKNKDHLQFTIGKCEVIVGLEQAVIGMKRGEKKSIMVPVHEAYGPYRDDLVLQVEKSIIPIHITPKVGQKLKVQQPDGRINIVTVTDISDTLVTMDANHPLAGKDLLYDILLVEIV